MILITLTHNDKISGEWPGINTEMMEMHSGQIVRGSIVRDGSHRKLRANGVYWTIAERWCKVLKVR